MPPDWLSVVAWIYLSVCFVGSAVIAYDIVVGHRRQPMGVMNLVFPITALYFGPAALALYWRWGRVGPRGTRSPSPVTGATMPQMEMAAAGPGARAGPVEDVELVAHAGTAEPARPARPGWATMAIEVSHCG